MKLGAKILNVLAKTYQPDQMIHSRFGRYDIAFKTDDQGRPILLFMGKADKNGNIIQGSRFVRHLQTDQAGKIIKDHWDNKGSI